MEIVFKLSEQDFLAFSDHHNAKSPTYRKANRRAVLSFVVMWAFGSYFVWRIIGDPVFTAAYLAIGVIAFFFVPSAVKGSRRKSATAAYREGKNRALFQEQTLRIERDVFAHESVASEGRLKWEYVEAVDVTDDFTFIYVSALAAHIIPKHGVIRGDYDAFVQEAHKRWQESTRAFEHLDHDIA